ncbi:DUF2975 domain-containing protein [Olleya sp. R77988]|uniref:DUF2975 domain-containing protein n=1 Tax=Olleya sp. R77988 TaxID=3093875 RepID=UPI0037C84231
MKAIKILKTIINIYYYLLIVGLLVKAIRVFNDIINGQIKHSKPKFLDENLDFANLSNTKIIVIIIIGVVLYCLLYLAVESIKNSLTDLEAGNYFSDLVINNFKKAGIILVFLSAAEFLGKISLWLYIKVKPKFEFDASITAFLLMGLFLMFLSEVFKKGKEVKEENDLTI